LKRQNHRFTLMEMILALFILSGTVTSLLVARQNNLRQIAEVQETRRSYQELESALDAMEARRNFPNLEIEELENIETETIEENISGLPVTLLRVSRNLPRGKILSLERYVTP
jgi:type II secretory pathway component PulJ